MYSFNLGVINMKCKQTQRYIDNVVSFAEYQLCANHAQSRR